MRYFSTFSSSSSTPKPGRSCTRADPPHDWQWLGKHIVLIEQRADDVAGIGVGVDAGRTQGQMDHGRAADAEFEIAADCAFDADGLCELRDCPRGPDAAGLADVNGKHVGCFGAGEDLRVVERVNAFVGDDWHRYVAAHLGHRRGIAGRNWLLGEIDLAMIAKLIDCLDRDFRRGPTAVGVDAELDRGADRFTNRAHAGHVLAADRFPL